MAEEDLQGARRWIKGDSVMGISGLEWLDGVGSY